ncbi:MAG TPA: exodeoxyribonuclease VII large subunit [Solirubrobacterales bacterium]|nr:exodeoxyribonuclease VII large subunit [Solirubrobacterales bacterium]
MDLPGPFPVGRYAHKLQEWMRERARVQLIGEVTGVGRSKVQAYFELRDSQGAVPCAIWLNDLEKAGLPEGALRDGVELVIAGGPDYYPGGGQASPSFSFRVTHVRLAGEGDLLARLEALRKQLRAEGLFELQKQLARPLLPRAIGVVTAETGAARRDLLAGLRRRGWGGTVVWAFAPVQDRHAAPAIAAAIQELAARPEVEAIVVTRGGGSLADLWAFCDETLCRTVAMLRVPVVSAIGHERDSTLIDDVAAVACSTPTHAAEAAVPLDCGVARQQLRRCTSSLRRAGEGAIGARARHLAALARGPARALQRERSGLNQKVREIRASSERRLAERNAFQRRIATVVLDRARRRGVERTAAAVAVEARRGAALERSAARSLEQRREALRRAAVTLRAHDPERTLERGYALAETESGKPVTSAGGAVAAAAVKLRFADGRVKARIEGDVEREAG